MPHSKEEVDMATIGSGGLNGAVIGSVDPQRLAAWYRRAFTDGADDAGGAPSAVVELGRSSLVFEQRADIAEETLEPGRWITNVVVKDLSALEAHLQGLGEIDWVRAVEPFALGRIGTIRDLDGNLVNVAQLEPLLDQSE